MIKKRWLADLLANENVVVLLLRFLKAIKVEGKKMA